MGQIPVVIATFSNFMPKGMRIARSGSLKSDEKIPFPQSHSFLVVLTKRHAGSENESKSNWDKDFPIFIYF